jgi:DNA replication protein DnaC
MIGPPGVGKTMLAVGLAAKASEIVQPLGVIVGGQFDGNRLVARDESSVVTRCQYQALPLRPGMSTHFIDLHP